LQVQKGQIPLENFCAATVDAQHQLRGPPLLLNVFHSTRIFKVPYLEVVAVWLVVAVKDFGNEIKIISMRVVSYSREGALPL
jgi:hypothetical protein